MNETFIGQSIMEMAVQQARTTMHLGHGGPFGAAIVKNEKIIALCSNSVLHDCDPTAHAEVNAIRAAGKLLETHDLTGCVLYATGYPCPMCLSAIIWANIKTVYYGCEPHEAEKIGFRDDFIYRYIEHGRTDSGVLVLKPLDSNRCRDLFLEYAGNGKIY